ncbi:MAG: hypothetical protein QXL17_08340 [Candidatus Thermoplasmatota archaeon]
MKKNRAYMFVIFFFIMSSVLLLPGCTNDIPDNDAHDLSWINNYTPVHSIGTGSNDFWVTYPSGNPSSGMQVTHLSWIVEALKIKPLLFVVHRTGCIGCADQAKRVIGFAEKYDEIVFYDLDAVYDASQDIFQKANEVYMYDPNGPPGYIALTGVFTYVEENNEIKIGWHTWEAPDDMKISDADLETWIKDAIYYHHTNKGKI